MTTSGLLVPPRATSQRWQPLRAGLVDVFLYDVEEFHFRDGNLLLRGNNGTGKSKVLAMLLPFLLDGEVSPHRVEPDGDPKKRMEWNLLMGGRHPNPDRLGYAWLEFGHVAADGTSHYRTIGAGIKAVAGRGSVSTWFFLTELRPGSDFSLVGPTRTALTRDRLADALGGHGQVFETASRYRRALDETFFDLGEERYDALVNLLIQLRQPQLSKKPDEKLLSNALTEALPPLDQAVVADTAEAFRSLEAEREDLRGFAEARDAANAFLAHYRRYAQLSSRRRAREPRSAQAEYESAGRSLADVRGQRAAAEQAEAEATAALARADEQLVRLGAEKETLAARPEMDQGRELGRLDRRARETGEVAARAETELSKATGQLADRQRREAQARDRLDRAVRRLDRVTATAAEAARPAGLAADHANAVGTVLGATAAVPADDVRAAERGALEAASRRENAVSHVAGLVRSHDRAVERHHEARTRHDAARSVADSAADDAEQAWSRASATGAELVAASRAHLEAAVELRLPELEQLLAELSEWVDDPDGDHPVDAAVAAAAREAAQRFGADDARLAAQAEAAERAVGELGAERAELTHGGDRPPRAPHTRDPQSRTGRLGAPLWKLVEPVDGTEPAVVAGLEAALEAAGLLDAWLAPDGRLLDPGTLDTVVVEADGPLPSSHLGVVLRPAVDREDRTASAVPDDTVARVLAGIGLGPQPEVRTWIGVDGRFQLGQLAGAWTKPAASYLGHAAREAARRRRLAEIDQELGELTARLAQIESGRLDLRRRRQQLDAEAAGLPSAAPVRTAHAAARRAQDSLRQAQRDVADAERAVRDAGAALAQAHEALGQAAAELGLPTAAEQLEAVRQALVEYRVRLADLWPSVRERGEAAARHAEAVGDVTDAQEHVGERAGLLESAREEQLRAVTAAETLRGTVGAAVAEVQRLLAAATSALDATRIEVRTLGQLRLELAGKLGEARGREQELQATVEAAGAARREAADRFRRLAASGMLRIALPELDVPDPANPWAPDPTVRLARQVEAALADVDDGEKAWERAQKLVANELNVLQEVLGRHGNHAVATITDDGWVVSTHFRNTETSPADLLDALVAEVADRERLLNEREREILENHLVSEVASHLQELISDAEQQVVRMNAELAERPNSTGMKLRFDWRPGPDAPNGLPAARDRLLRQVADAWSPADREAVGEFLQAQINNERQKDEGGTWLEHLSRALDYRRWHVFVVQRYSDGQWRPASGPASGGERALVVTIPLFAAASSHYRSAGNPLAPRLVMLDEAFAGVDDDARASCLGLLAEFEMDVVMTSEREWGCYRTVPGLSICQLSRREGIDAVLVTRWEWDGRERRRAEPLAVAAQRTPVEPATNGLGSPNGSAGPNGSRPPNGSATELWE